MWGTYGLNLPAVYLDPKGGSSWGPRHEASFHIGVNRSRWIRVMDGPLRKAGWTRGEFALERGSCGCYLLDLANRVRIRPRDSAST